MAITKTPEVAAFDAFDTLAAADSSNANGLAKLTQSGGAYTSNAVLIGNINGAGNGIALIRRGDPDGTDHYPRIEVEPLVRNRRDAAGHARVEMVVRLHYFTGGTTPAGFTSQNNVLLRARSVFPRVQPSATGGWTFSVLHEPRGFQVSRTPTEQHYVEEYAVTMTADGEF
jgi:hypothetical protein